MSISSVVEQKRTRIVTPLSTKPLVMGLTAVDIGWVFHLMASLWMGYHAFHGDNPLAWMGLNAPAYKIGVVALAEGARAILSMADVWEAEINYVASTVLVLVLLSAGGADMNRVGQVVPSFNYHASVANVQSAKKYNINQCTFTSSVLNRALNAKEKEECIAINKLGMMDDKWAKNCGCSS